MDKDINIDIESLKNSVENIEQEQIPEDLFFTLERSTRLSAQETTNSTKLSKLLQDPEGFYQLTYSGGQVDLKEPIFAKTLGFEPDREGTFELIYSNILGQEKKLTLTELNNDKRIVFTINDAIKRFKLRYEKKLISLHKKTSIRDIKIYGYTFETIISELDYFREVDDDRKQYEQKIINLKTTISNELARLINKKEEYEEYLETNNNYESELVANIDDLQEKKKNLQTNINQQNSEIESLSSQITAKDNQLSKLNEDFLALQKRSKYLTEGNDRLEERRRELEKSVNLFPDNLEGFVTRATRTKWAYGFLAFIPLVILGFIVNLSWDTLKDFTAITTVDTFEKAWIILIQRLPFTLLIITLASMCLAFLYKMVRHLTEIQQQELNLSKISMLARDVSDSEHSSLDEEIIQKLRIDRKMKLIREFLNSEFNRYQIFVNREEKIKSTEFIKIDLPFKIPFKVNKSE
ncbi:coiled-coil domain-containing protein [Acinetobacter venetianus]|uniref:Chromosome partition protein Smc n=1 Tax=Acinetobacter venetianus TaxID=52133 RepID=A0A150HVL5_9GAMM|nr:hypothetical protein [Acinetobacter venetianus]KXZ71055.1 Chromosome partition protein Smc [Acinetobacter venetianus]